MRGRTLFCIGLTAGSSAAPLCCSAEHRGERRRYDYVPVIIATVDVPAGTKLSFDMISQRSFPEVFVTSQAVKPDSASYVVNQVVQTDVHAGEPILWTQFGRGHELLRPTTRMVDVDVDSDRALGDQLGPRDRVDVMLTFVDPATGQWTSRAVVENAVVAKIVERSAPKPTSVQLVVPAEEAGALLIAPQLGRLALVLRDSNDGETIPDHNRTTAAEVLEGLGTQRWRFGPVAFTPLPRRP